MLEIHDPGTHLGESRLGNHQGVPEPVVEPDGQFTGQLEVLALVVSDRYPFGVVEQDVGALEDRVGEQTNPHRILAVTLLLELGHPAQLAHGGGALEQPGHLNVLGDVALHEQGAALGIQSGGQEIERRLVGAGPQFVRVDVQGEGMEVDDGVEAVVGILVGNPIADRPQVIPQMEVATGLEAGQNSGHGWSS